MNTNRLNRIYESMKLNHLEQLIVSDSNSIFYLTGKWIYPGERFMALLITIDSKPKLILNDLFSFFDNDVEVVYYNDSEQGTKKVFKFIDHSMTLGVDKYLPSRFLIEFMEMHTACAYSNSSILVDNIRAVKDEEEIKLMIHSSKLNDLCMEEFKNSIRLHQSEKELQNIIYDIYKRHNLSTSFTPIVAFKATAADPHHESDDKTILEDGDMILLDVGGKYQNYCSDMTRVFFTKKPTSFEEKIYNLVKKANLEAIKMIKPGVELSLVDKKARDIITDAGYGKYFNHRLGHFIGIEDHDYGDVSRSSTIIAKEGMIFSIEPGIYIKDKIGVRIEDLVLVTKDGVKVLNEYSKDIQILNLR